MNSTQRYTPITSDNLTTFPAGTKVRFEYGAMCGNEDGVIVDHVTDRWGSHLIAVKSDGSRTSINGFSTVGIGVYLVD